MANPLTDAGTVTAATNTAQNISSENWVASGLRSLGGIVPGLASASDPIAFLGSSIAKWALDHLEPLKGWLNAVTGDEAKVKEGAANWTTLSGTLTENSKKLEDSVTTTLANQTSQALEAYKQLQTDLCKNINASATMATAISKGLTVASSLVKIVHDLVRDAIADVAGVAISAAIEAMCTLGFGIADAIRRVVQCVVKWAKELASKIKGLIESFTKLKDLFSKVGEIVQKVQEILKAIQGFLDKGSSTVPQLAAASAG